MNNDNKGSFDPLEFPEVKNLFDELFSSLFNESGRGAILIATAHVEIHLKELIEAVFPADMKKSEKERLLNYPGHLSSFSSKIELAFAFKLINRNLYNSLNALRKVRNDAAHSHSKFELHELNEKLKNIYELGPNFAYFIKEISSKALIQSKMETVKTTLDLEDLNDDDKKEIFTSIFNDPEKISLLEKQVPFWELLYGLTFLCSLLVHNKRRLEKFGSSFDTIPQLIEKCSK